MLHTAHSNLTAECRVADNGGKLKAVDVNKKELELEVKELKSLSEAVEAVKEKYPGLVHMRWLLCSVMKCAYTMPITRVPVCNSAAPTEADFDIITASLVGTAVNTPIIVSDQVSAEGD